MPVGSIAPPFPPPLLVSLFSLRDGMLWARFVITSVALIYAARLTVYSLSHTLDVPEEFNSFKMPKWWTIYRKLGNYVRA